MIRVLDEFPKFSLWKRFLRRICGGQDIVAVVVISEGSATIRWLDGVDIQQPLSIKLEEK